MSEAPPPIAAPTPLVGAPPTAARRAPLWLRGVWLAVQVVLGVVFTIWAWDFYTRENPPIPRFPEANTFGQWHSIEGREVLFLDLNLVASNRLGNPIWVWEHQLDPMFHPTGTMRFAEGIYRCADNLACIVLHGGETKYSLSYPEQVTVPVPPAARERQPTHLWLYGCMAAFNDRDRHTHSCEIEVLFEDRSVQTWRVTGKDIWPGAKAILWEPGYRQWYAYKATKMEFDETALEIAQDRGGLLEVRLRDTGTFPSNLWFALSLEQRAPGLPEPGTGQQIRAEWKPEQ